MIDRYHQAPEEAVLLFFQSLSQGRPRRSDSEPPELEAARAVGLGGDVGLCQARSLAPSQLGGWKTGGLQTHKKKVLIPLPDESAPGSAWRQEGAAGARPFTPKTVSSHRSGGCRRSAASSGKEAAMSREDRTGDPLPGDPVAGEETGTLGRWDDLA